MSFIGSEYLVAKFKRSNCEETKETSAHILIPYERSMHLVLRQNEWLVRVFSLLLEILSQIYLSLSKTAISNRY